MFRISQFKKITRQAGFTIIEFIVIMAIFAIMASISLYNFQGFDESTNINNLALDIALEIKRAQTLGSSSIDSSAGEKQAMSVFFEHNGSEFEQAFTVVRQVPSGGFGDLLNIQTPPDSIDRRSEIFGGIIRDICIDDGGGCDSLSDDIVISFRRPYTEPLITSTAPSCNGSVTDLRSEVTYYQLCEGTLEIQLESNDGTRKRTVVIEQTGNIFTRNS